ncbi:hypothetical protein FMM65_13625 [Citrobacter youngae]|nr:hypothetical protein FMM65_13625 [Citrobacter youngae]
MTFFVALIPHITKSNSLNNDFFEITITKQKRFFMGALVGALFTRNINKTNNKQHLNRGYDSESGTTIWKNPPMAGFLLLANSHYSLFTELCFNSA